MNDWATDTMNDAHYPLSLLARWANVSLKIVQLMGALPSLDQIGEA